MCSLRKRVVTDTAPAASLVHMLERRLGSKFEILDTGSVYARGNVTYYEWKLGSLYLDGTDVILEFVPALCRKGFADMRLSLCDPSIVGKVGDTIEEARRVSYSRVLEFSVWSGEKFSDFGRWVDRCWYLNPGLVAGVFAGTMFGLISLYAVFIGWLHR